MILEMTRPVQGGLRQERKLEAVSNHLANTDTAGFKKDVVSFDMMFKAQFNTDYSQGSLRKTDNDLDLALQREGFFKVNTQDGIRYTRDGHFTLNSQGILVNQDGEAVQGQNGNIVLNGELVQINGAGAIELDGELIDTLDIVTFDDLTKLDKMEGGRYAYNGNPQNDEVIPESISVKQGALEGSNVQVVDEMVTMIDHHRIYETFQKMMQTFDEVDGKAITEVGRPS